MGLVARVIEQAGIPTVLVSTGRDLTTQVRPPRSLFVNFPMGNPFGRSGDVAMQRRVLVAALELAATAQHEGVLVDFPCDWGAPFASLVDAVTDAM